MTVLNFLWHFHQPDYRHPVSGVPVMPWVRLHAVKGYLDLLTALRAANNARVCVNFSGVLLHQLRAYVDDGLLDRWGEISQLPANDLDEAARQVVLANFFSAHPENLIQPHARYWQLKQECADLVARHGLDEAARVLSEDDLTDLMVWFNLAWIGFTGQRRREVRELVNRGRGYSHTDQQQVLAIHRELAAEVLPGYRALAESGQIELSTTPMNHPILPLLIDLQEGAANPDDPLPGFQHPEDAAKQVALAQQVYAETFGRPPRGMWPAEGSVSDAALASFSEAGLEWIATDQSNLPQSGHLPHLSAWRWERDSRSLHCFFRDTRLADNIGFEYARWQPAVAGQHLAQMARMLGAQASGQAAVVTLALDGENPWENYTDGGEQFLSAMFAAIAAEAEMDCATPSAIIAMHDWPRLEHIHSGSWVGGNFDIWSRHGDTRRAWRLLAQARADLDTQMSDAEVERHLLVAESSDWFWWYGDDFVSEQQWQFDELFRGHLIAAYGLAGVGVPEVLYQPILSHYEPAIAKPDRLISPVLDGRVSSYYEWRGALELNLAGVQGAMARASNGQNGNGKPRAWYGYSTDALWLRLDLPEAWLEQMRSAGCSLELELTRDENTQRFIFAPGETGGGGPAMYVDRIVELSIPLGEVTLSAGVANTSIVCTLAGNDEELRLPTSGRAAMQLLGQAEVVGLWTV